MLINVFKWNSIKKRISKETRSTIINNIELDYTHVTSTRAKYARITIHRTGGFSVTVPSYAPKNAAENFIRSKELWIQKKLELVESFPQLPPSPYSKKTFQVKKKEALTLAQQTITKVNRLYNLSYGTIRIKNHKTLWGSCSRKGNLNFNYKIIFLPENLLTYIVTHEICHLQEFNHSPQFWKLVEKTIPDYKLLRNELKAFGKIL